MFTGIIEEAGVIRSVLPKTAGATVVVEASQILPGLKLGDSVAVNGACLTVVEIHQHLFSADLSAETLRRTSLNRPREGMVVNLERPLAVGERLGGHIVQGHVDDVGRLVSFAPSGEGWEMEFRFPPEFARYLVPKGSVAVDGISLTVASLTADTFTVAVIPLTYRTTNLRTLKPGDVVNLEGDILAKYFERFFQLGLVQAPAGRSQLSVDRLREEGF